jgi:polysaccharide pyruvyl transferase WcaK-like protein
MEAGERGEDVIRLLRSVQLVVSMRLHTLIFAAGLGIPMVGVVYDPKVSGFLDDLGQTRYLPLREAKGETLCRLIDEALQEQATNETVTHLRTLAAKNQTLAAQLLQL